MKTQLLALALVGILAAARAAAAPVTNADIEKLIAAGMGDSVILSVIAGGDPAQFDTSPDALIALKVKGASQAVLAAMAMRMSPPPAAALAPPPAQRAFPTAMQARAQIDQMQSAMDTICIDGDKRTSMAYSDIHIRMGGMFVAAISFGAGAREYWSISGAHAILRLKNPRPAFIFSVPHSAHPDNNVYLTRWASRSSNVREIVVGQSKLHFDSTDTMGTINFPDDRVVPIDLAQAKDEAGNAIPDRYEARPRANLAPDEYVLVVTHSAFDFAIDKP